jgi:hypothetical protein
MLLEIKIRITRKNTRIAREIVGRTRGAKKCDRHFVKIYLTKIYVHFSPLLTIFRGGWNWKGFQRKVLLSLIEGNYETPILEVHPSPRIRPDIYELWRRILNHTQ